MKLDRTTLALLIVFEIARLAPSQAAALNVLTLAVWVQACRVLAPSRCLALVRNSAAGHS